jgi:hypothetical protein
LKIRDDSFMIHVLHPYISMIHSVLAARYLGRTGHVRAGDGQVSLSITGMSPDFLDRNKAKVKETRGNGVLRFLKLEYPKLCDKLGQQGYQSLKPRLDARIAGAGRGC